MRVEQTSKQASQPVFFEAVKDHLRIEHSAADAEIDALISAAASIVEDMTGLSLISRTVDIFIDAWPASKTENWWDGVRDGAIADLASTTEPLRLDRSAARPLQSVEAITVYDADGVGSVWSALNYDVTPGEKPKITPKNALPAVGKVAEGIKISATIGFGDSPNDVPPAIKAAVKNLVAHLWRYRGVVDGGTVSSALPFNVKTLLAPYIRRENRVRF